jgi:hypothetical protein
MEDINFSFKQLGFKSALNHQSNPEAISGCLSIAYSSFLQTQQQDEKGLQNRAAQLNTEITQERNKKNGSNTNLADAREQRDNKQKEIDALELEKIEMKNGVDGIDIPTFIISAFITILLTLYLFVFYASSGYSAFIDLPKDSLTFINPNVFSEAFNKGGAVIAFVILFPVIFLGLGFLIHNSIEINKKRKEENKPKSYTLIIVLLTITLIADAFIGYKISKAIYINELNTLSFDAQSIPWEFNMIFSDTTFYLVLVLGFVVYVIWGFLLNIVLSHPYLKPESEQIKLMQEQIQRRIDFKRGEQKEIVTKISQFEIEIMNSENIIDEKQKILDGIESGRHIIDIPALEATIAKFMGGWQTFTENYYLDNPEESSKLRKEASKRHEEWLENTLKSLKES